MTSATENANIVRAIEALSTCIAILAFETDILRRENREQAEKLALNLNKCCDALADMRKEVRNDRRNRQPNN